MTDATVVSLCKQYLETWDHAILPVLADRLEELGDGEESRWHRNHWCFGVQLFRYPNTVANIQRKYGDEDA